MAKTNFIAGLTPVLATFMNKIFNHDHLGNDEDGSNPKITEAEMQWGIPGGGEVTVAVSSSEHIIEQSGLGGRIGKFVNNLIQTDKITLASNIPFSDDTELIPDFFGIFRGLRVEAGGAIAGITARAIKLSGATSSGMLNALPYSNTLWSDNLVKTAVSYVVEYTGTAFTYDLLSGGTYRANGYDLVLTGGQYELTVPHAISSTSVILITSNLANESATVARTISVSGGKVTFKIAYSDTGAAVDLATSPALQINIIII